MPPITSIHDIVTIKNISGKDFTFQYDASTGNPPYVIHAGEIKRFPRFLAAHAVKHLIDQIMNDNDERTSNLVRRQELAEQIIVDEETFHDEPVVTEADRLNKQIEELNRPSDLDGILEKRRVKKEVAAAQKPIGTQPNMDQPAKPKVKQEEEFAGLNKDQPKEPEKPKPVIKEVKPKEALPDRAQLMKYATDVLKMEIDAKTQKALDSLSVPELIKELQYPLKEDK